MPIDFDSYGLDDELKAKLKADYESDISGLKAKNADLIEREKAAKLAAEETAVNAAKAEEDAKVALAEKEGNIEAYKVAVAQRDEKLEAIQLEFKQKETQRIADLATSEFVGKHVSSDPAARKYMESIYRENIDVVDGAAKPKDVTKTLEELQKALVSDENFSKYIKVDVGSGSSASGANGSGSANPKLTDKEQRIAAINQKFGEAS